VISVPGMSAGSSQTLTVNIADSAVGGFQDAISTPAAPRMLPRAGCGAGGSARWARPTGFCSRFAADVLSPSSPRPSMRRRSTETKALLALGVWDAFDPVSARR